MALLDGARAARTPLLVLLSGGASALACVPRGVSLTTKRALTELLLARGAAIGELNVVRRHLSKVKGGGLLCAAAPKRVHTLVVSDVLTDTLHDIGSGPTVPDPTSVDDARRALVRFAPEWGALPFAPTLHPFAPAARRGTSAIVLSPRVLAAAVARALERSLGVKTSLLAPFGGSVEDARVEYARQAAVLGPGEALVRAAEPTVVLAERAGRGGRSTHLAASLAGALPDDVAFLAAASDGVDGRSGTAGAVVDGALGRSAVFRDVERALDRFDTAPLHEAAGSAVRLGPTGHNLADVHVLARRPRG
jgi:hydroxypyruvate reductase